MQIPWQTDSGELDDNFLYLAHHALEAPQSNQREQVGTVTLSCTANTLTGQTVAFNKPYAKGKTPYVIAGITALGTPASQVTVSAVNATNTAVTIQAYSSVTQSVTVAYRAIGQTGGA